MCYDNETAVIIYRSMAPKKKKKKGKKKKK